MTAKQWTNLIIVLLFVGFSVLSWAYRQFREYQNRQNQKQQAERRREQLLRTGRSDDSIEQSVAPMAPMQAPPTAPDVHDDARRRLQELAQRRRAELEAMARRAAGGDAAPPPTSAPPMSSGPRPSKPVPVQRAPQSIPQPRRYSGDGGSRSPALPTPKPRKVEQSRKITERVARAEEAERQAGRARVERIGAEADARQAAAERETVGSAAAAALADGTGEAARAVRPSMAAAFGAAKLGPGASSATVDQWRRAIVLMEIMGPSVAMREGQGPGLGI